MGLFDALQAQTPEGEILRNGLLQAGMGMLAGSYGNYGALAPALAGGVAGFAKGTNQAQQMQMDKAQQEQMAKYRAVQMRMLDNDLASQAAARNFFQQAGGAGAGPAGVAPLQMSGDGVASTSAAGGGRNLNDLIEQGLVNPDPEIRKWATDQQRLLLQKTGGVSGLVPTTEGYAFRDANGNMVQAINPATGKPFMPVSALGQDAANQGEIAAAKAYGATTGKTAAERPAATRAATSSLDASLSNMDRLKNAASELKEHPGLPGITGLPGAFPNMRGGEAANANTKLTSLKSQVAFSVLQAMRDASKTGGALGAVSEKELALLENNLAALDTAQSYEQYQQELDKIVKFVDDAQKRMVEAYQREYGGEPKGEASASGGARPALSDIF